MREAFGRPDTDAGYLIGAFGGGAVLAAFLVAGRVTGSRRRMAVTLTLLGGGMVAYSLVPWLSLGVVFLVVAGFGYLASNTAATSRLTLDVAEHHRGRIMALWSVAFLGFRPIASLADGAIGRKPRNATLQSAMIRPRGAPRRRAQAARRRRVRREIAEAGNHEEHDAEREPRDERVRDHPAAEQA